MLFLHGQQMTRLPWCLLDGLINSYLICPHWLYASVFMAP
jgi:hypothetical protein